MARYGGFFGGLVKGVLNAFVRESLVQMGRKQPHRGGIRITQTKHIMEGKDKYGRPRSSRRGNRRTPRSRTLYRRH